MRRRVAEFHERHVVHIGAKRNGDDRLVAERLQVRQIVVEYVAVPNVAGLGEEARRVRPRGAARTEPALDLAAGRLLKQRGAAHDVRALLLLGH